MCGFVAVVGRVGEGELERMAQAVALRGPDDRGELHRSAFHAIHHRLSIIGPDVRGRQPMTIGNITVLFNGCIYNYPQLRRELEADGVVFVSATDTEVLPHLFARYGTEMFARLNGMFALVLWDAATQQVTIARDRCGEKPLFLCQQAGRIGLASTLSAFERGDWQLTPNVLAVGRLLTTMRVEPPMTLYGEVQQLPSGCWAQGSLGAELTLNRFYRLPPPNADHDFDRNCTLPQLAQEAEQRIDAAFAMRRLSDRPLGVFLSGGVDSSLIAASLTAAGSAPLRTFAVRFAGGDDDYDETPFAAKVARHLGCDHQCLVVQPDADATLDAMAAAFDQPVTNAAALPTYLISQAAKGLVDVALSGVGGDELFGGYPRYLGLAWHPRLQHLPGRGAALALLHQVGDSATSSRNLRGRLRRFLLGLSQTPADAYRHWMGTTDAELAEMLTQPVVQSPDGWPTTAWPSAAEDHGGLESLLAGYGMVNGAMAYDQLTYLADDLLPVADRMSMAHGLELRAPFLDPDLMRYALQLDARFKVAGMPWREGLKILLKAVACRRLPREVVHRPKQGFMAPLKLWLRQELRGAMEDLTSRNPVGGLIRRSFVQAQWQRHLAGEDRSDMLWGILLLDRWAAQRGWIF
ncbi:MAG: asparagine synthase (glutamine-hydrolyzing) [Mariprofundales bacterium]|nr:asparagine synthase (glutamine-hydrolyzing) [Mariprofundales bacterium]